MVLPAVVRRHKRLLKRQPTSSWVKDYTPGTLAVRGEAPKLSIATEIRNTQKFGRSLHALSKPETAALLLSLWLPEIVDVNEQRVLPPFESANPLAGFPPAKGQRLSNLKGMYSAYERLDAEELYGVIHLGKEREYPEVPVLYEGDILNYCIDAEGPYCVNWTVKRTADQFDQFRVEVPKQLQTKRENEKALVRHAAEEIFYADVGIPTYRVTSDLFSRVLVRNMRTSYRWAMGMTSELQPLLPRAEMLVRNSAGSGDTGVDLGEYFCRKSRISAYEWKILLYSLIWHRRLNIDLDKAFLIDQPIKICREPNNKKFLPFIRRCDHE